MLSFALVLELLLEKLVLVNKKSLALPFNLVNVITVMMMAINFL